MYISRNKDSKTNMAYGIPVARAFLALAASLHDGGCRSGRGRLGSFGGNNREGWGRMEVTGPGARERGASWGIKPSLKLLKGSTIFVLIFVVCRLWLRLRSGRGGAVQGAGHVLLNCLLFESFKMGSQLRMFMVSPL